MDFETGKLRDVALHHHGSVGREYRLFWSLLAATSIPYAIAGFYHPTATICVMLSMGYFQVLATLARSSGTSTSHYMRFLLAGSNPIGMTGGSSLLFGAVDAIFDWREDRASRQRNPPLFWAQTMLKFALTPIGVVLWCGEVAWDLLLLRGPRLARWKWHELFALAWYHDVICPEKSNDVFYADLAFSRYQQDANLYQWHRMRAMVFELKQYFDDVRSGGGVPESNLFLQSDIAAYQTLKRLQIESVETAIQNHYREHLEEFPFPRHLAERLIKSARPITHYEKMRSQLGGVAQPPGDRNPDSDAIERFGDRLRARFHEDVSVWKVLRLLDAEPPLPPPDSTTLPPLPAMISPALSPHVRQSDLNSLCAWGILDRHSDFEFAFSAALIAEWQDWLDTHYVAGPLDALDLAAVELIPDFFVYRGKLYLPGT